MSGGETTQVQVQRAFQRDFDDGEVIFEEGDEGAELYVVQSGGVEIHRAGGGSARVVAKLGPGDFFGEMSVVLGEARTASAVAVGPTELLEIDGETFEAMCVDRPEVALRMIRRLAQRLIGAERRLAAFGLDQLVEPLVRFLAAQPHPANEVELRVSTTLRRLSEACELSLQETHQALHMLIDRKLLRVVDQELVVPDRAALLGAMDRFSAAR